MGHPPLSARRLHAVAEEDPPVVAKRRKLRSTGGGADRERVARGFAREDHSMGPRAAVENWLRRPESERSMSLLDHLARHAPLVFAHHSERDGLAEHTFRWHGLYLCRGCVMASVGILIGLAVGFSTFWVARLSTPQLAAALAAMVAPTIATTLWRGPRPIRDACRLILGAAVGSSLVAVVLVESWVVKITIVLAFLVGRSVLGGHRRKTMTQA